MKNSDNPALIAFEGALAQEMNALEGATDPALLGAMTYAMSGGGKRVRPILMLLAADAVGIPRKKIMPLACALECIHNYSLIHDDLPCMDDDDTRRGLPTVHKVYGEAIAVLAGDALLNLGHEIMLKACVKDFDLLSASLAISEAAGARGMAGGQSAEFSIKNPSKDDLVYIYALKTGALLRAAITAPFLVMRSPLLGDAQRLAFSAGFVFQLVDDLLDYRAGGDKDKPTFAALYGEQETEAEIARQNSICSVLFDKLSDARGAEALRGLREYTNALSHRLI